MDLVAPTLTVALTAAATVAACRGRLHVAAVALAAVVTVSGAAVAAELGARITAQALVAGALCGLGLLVAACAAAVLIDTHHPDHKDTTP